jgi:hypothetical protein
MTEHQQALEYMNNKRSKNTCNKFKYIVQINHGDGSVFVLHNAYLEIKLFGKFEMLLVYTEHCGYHAFYMDDLEFWRKFK